MELDETNTEPGPADAGETRAEAVPTTTQEARPPARDGEAEVATPAPAAVAVPADKPRRAPARTVAHLTPAERVARGKAARTGVSRRSHGEWEPSPARPDPIVLLEDQARTRVPELVPIRYGRMLVSPFAFFRGAAYIMAADLAAAPRSGLHAQLCGDAHLSNFGGFAAPDRRIVFSLNDFDETLPGPFEWDVKRLVASFVVAARELGFDEAARRAAVAAGARSYRTAMQEFARKGVMDIWYARLEIDHDHRPVGTRGGQEARQEAPAERRQGPDQGQPEGPREADRGRRRSPADRRRPTSGRPDRGSDAAGGRRPAGGDTPVDHPLLPTHAAA